MARGYRTGNFKVFIEDDGDVSVKIRALGRQGGPFLKDVAEGAARHGADIMRAFAPVKTGQLKGRIGSTPARFVPGGQGGGGNYVATAGVRKVGPQGDRQEYPTHVFHGTGVPGPRHRPIQVGAGNVMKIEGWTKNGAIKQREMDRGRPLRKPRPGPIFTKRVWGRYPQTKWVENAQRSTEDYVRRRMTDYHRKWITNKYGRDIFSS